MQGGFVKYDGSGKLKYTPLTDDNFVTYIKCENYKVLTCTTSYSDFL